MSSRCSLISSKISSWIGDTLVLSVLAGMLFIRLGLDVCATVGEETFARAFKGDVPMTFREVVSGNMAGDGRDDVGLWSFIAEVTIGVCSKSCVPAKGTPPFTSFWIAKGFLGGTGVSGGRPAGLKGVWPLLGRCCEVASGALHSPRVFSKPASSETWDDGRAPGLKFPKLTAPVSSTCSVSGRELDSTGW